jgi:adiponectin receptor
VGTGIFAALYTDLLTTREIISKLWPGEPLSASDVSVIGVYLMSGIVCFLLSSIYHTLTSAPENILAAAERADHIGILTLMLGSNFPMIYYGFFNKPEFILLHTAMSIGAIAIAIGALQFDKLQKQKLWIFLAVVAVGWSQLAHDLYLRGALGSDQSNHAILVWVRSFACYAVGVVFYSGKVPERIAPGRFNIFLSSHQIWHVAVVIGALVHLGGCLEYARLARLVGAA